MTGARRLVSATPKHPPSPSPPTLLWFARTEACTAACTQNVWPAGRLPSPKSDGAALRSTPLALRTGREWCMAAVLAGSPNPELPARTRFLRGLGVRQAQKVAPAIRMISKKLSQEATASAMRKTQMPSASERPAQAHAVPTTVTARRKSRAMRAKRKAFLS